MCGSVGAIFLQIYHRTDRDRYSHNWNQCTPVRVGFLTYSGTVFCGLVQLVYSIWIIKITIYFFIKKIGLLGPISIHNMFKIPSKMYKLFTQTTNLFIHQPKYPFDMSFKRGKKNLFNSTLWNISIVTLFSSSTTKNTNTFKKLKANFMLWWSYWLTKHFYDYNYLEIK